MPSSRSEFLGASDFDLPWGDFSSALERLIRRLGVEAHAIALKAHPVWSQYVAKKSGEHILRHYREWASRNGVGWVGPEDATSTNELIRRADIVVVGGSTAGVDAALAGKKVVLLGPAAYEGAAFTYTIKDDDGFGSLDALRRHDPVETCRKALRYLYTTTFRFPYFSDCVVPVNFFAYTFTRPDPNRPGWVPVEGDGEPWLAESASEETWENEAIRQWMSGEVDTGSGLDDLMRINDDAAGSRMAIERRFLFRGIDRLRNLLPRGDRMGASGHGQVRE